MRNICVKPVNLYWKLRGISSVQVSTEVLQNLVNPQQSSVQTRLIHLFIPLNPHSISPAKLLFLPLFEYIFYPVSTAPTITSIKKK